MRKIIIIGSGNIGKSINRGLQRYYDIKSNIYDIKQRTANTNILTNGFDITGYEVILSVKKRHIEKVKKMLSGKANVIYSVIPDYPQKELEQDFNSISYKRTIPNISSEFNKSYTIVYGKKDITNNIFLYLGKIKFIEKEEDYEKFIKITSSTQAYIANIFKLLEEEMAKDNIQFEEYESKEFIKLILDGYISLNSVYTNENIINKIATPGGITENYLKHFFNKKNK
jgi:pyrroline-5-carboxylate reductase